MRTRRLSADSPLPAYPPRIPIDIRRFPWIRPSGRRLRVRLRAVSPIFRGQSARIRRAWRDAIARTQRHPRQRDAIAELVAGTAARACAPHASDRRPRASLRDPQTVAIVTGQQAGLFGGPLFTLLKALTAVRLAERVRSEHGVPAVAIFWIDAEDHDWDEVKRAASSTPT